MVILPLSFPKLGTKLEQRTLISFEDIKQALFRMQGMEEGVYMNFLASK